jgi:hypothetical protein
VFFSSSAVEEDGALGSDDVSVEAEEVLDVIYV